MGRVNAAERVKWSWAQRGMARLLISAAYPERGRCGQTRGGKGLISVWASETVLSQACTCSPSTSQDSYMGSSKKPHCQESLGPSKAQASKATLLQVIISKDS